MKKLVVIFGVEVKSLWKPMHMQPLYKSYMHYLNGVSENAYRLGLFLPSGSSMTKAQRDQIEYIIKKL